MNKITYSTIILFVTCSVLRAQNDKVPYVPPSPNASSLLEYASVPVNLYSGTTDVSVPLLELKGRKLSVPVSVSYHASGIKVQDISSSVGLGWALNAGGVITRTVRGIADESSDGYFNSDFNSIMNDASRFATTDLTDTEPDIFYYNFGGKTGRLVMTPTQNPIQLPENNLKIKVPNFSVSDPTWEIVDTDGVKYVFGKTANSRETTTSTLDYPVRPKTYISSWFLSEIVYPFNTDKITFTYQEGASIYYENYGQALESSLSIITNSQPPFGFGATFGVKDVITQITINAPKYISVINSILGNVNFLYADDRLDVTHALRLSQIVLKNLSGEEIKKYDLVNNLYFVSDDCSSSDCKRLKLERIVNTTNGANLTLESFLYSAVNLPSRKTIKYDHWGYYNSNTYSNAIPTSKVYYNSSGAVTFGGADKSPDLLRTQANILTTVTNASGGIQILEYELNAHDDGSASPVPTGGLRIARITENDGSGKNGSIVRNYSYMKILTPTKSSGHIYRKYTYDYIFTHVDNVSQGYNQYVNVLSSSSSLINLFDIGGSHVGYSEVVINYSNGSKEQYYFTNFNSNDDDPVTLLSGTDPDGPPFISKGDRSYERGLLIDQIFLNNAGGKIKKIHNEYDFYLASSLEAPGGRILMTGSTGSSSASSVRGQYKYTHRGVRLLETVETTYDQLDETQSFVRRRSLTYNPSLVYSNVVQTSTDYLNDGSEYKKQYRYPLDFISIRPGTIDTYSDGLYELGKAGIIVPIEELTYLKNVDNNQFELIDAQILGYKKYTKNSDAQTYTCLEGVYKLKLTVPNTSFTQAAVDFPVSPPSAVFLFNNTNYKKIHTYNSYDDYGNVLSESSEDGQVFQYTWGSNSSLVTSINKNNEYSLTYNHKPLVGLNYVTDANNRNVNFAYDKLNRLQSVKDHNGSIQKGFRYNYKNNNEFAADFLVSGNQSASSPISFSSTLETESTGTTTYIWDFGDGQVSENAGRNVNHSYSAPGNYNVKLSKVNPEYGSLTIMKTLIIYDTPSVSLSRSAASVNVCTESGSTITASITQGCPTVTEYKWYYSTSSNGPWTQFSSGTDNNVLFEAPANLGLYYVKCEMKDGCAQIGSSSSPTSVNFYKNPTTCGRI